MNQPRRKRPEQRRTARPKRPTPADIWRTADPLPDVEPITIPDEVGALLRSLGDPPMIAGSVIASHYFTAVIERAAAVAAALALSADLLAQPTDEQAQQSNALTNRRPCTRRQSRPDQRAEMITSTTRSAAPE